MSKQINVEPIDVDKVENETQDVLVLAEQSSLTITDQPEYDSAAELLKKVKARYKELDSERKEITSPLDEAKKKVMALFKKPLDLLSNAENSIKRAMISYTNEQERKAREEQRRLQEIADKAAAEEKKRLEAKIARAEASGKEEKAEALKEEIENIVPIAVPVVAPQVTKPQGVSYKDKYTAEVIDFALLPDEYKLPNQSALDRIAQATKGTVPIPGVKFHSEKILSSRS